MYGASTSTSHLYLHFLVFFGEASRNRLGGAASGLFNSLLTTFFDLNEHRAYKEIASLTWLKTPW